MEYQAHPNTLTRNHYFEMSLHLCREKIALPHSKRMLLLKTSFSRFPKTSMAPQIYIYYDHRIYLTQMWIMHMYIHGMGLQKIMECATWISRCHKGLSLTFLWSHQGVAIKQSFIQFWSPGLTLLSFWRLAYRHKDIHTIYNTINTWCNYTHRHTHTCTSS